MAEHGLSESVIETIRNPPWKISTTAQYYNFFDEAKEVRTRLFDAVLEWKNDGSILANLKMAWKVSEGIVADMINKKAEKVPEMDVDEPLGVAEKQSLEETWKTKYDFVIPPSWQCIRLSMALFQVQGLQTMESVSSLGRQGKRARLGYQLTLHMGDSEPPQTQFPVDNIFRYMMGLKTIIFTMGKAGAFYHEEEGERVIFAPLTPLLAHLAAAEAYALKFT